MKTNSNSSGNTDIRSAKRADAYAAALSGRAGLAAPQQAGTVEPGLGSTTVLALNGHIPAWPAALLHLEARARRGPSLATTFWRAASIGQW